MSATLMTLKRDEENKIEVHTMQGVATITRELKEQECSVKAPGGTYFSTNLLAPYGEPIVEIIDGFLNGADSLSALEEKIRQLSSVAIALRQMLGSKGRPPGYGLGGSSKSKQKNWVAGDPGIGKIATGTATSKAAFLQSLKNAGYSIFTLDQIKEVDRSCPMVISSGTPIDLKVSTAH